MISDLQILHMRKMKLLIFLTLVAYGGAVIQEIVLHESPAEVSGNYYIFRRPVPDTTIYPFVSNIVYFCHNTRMELYSNINYEGSVTGAHDSTGCHNINLTDYKSFRFFGNRDTAIDAVSLFPETYLRGEEILADRSPFGGITQPIASVAYSGKTGWTVFEGSNFNGRTSCLPAAATTNTIAFNDLSLLNITNIGSLYKGCLSNVTPQMRSHMRRTAFRI